MTGKSRTTISLSQDHVRRLDEAADQHGRPRSEIIRNALDAFFDSDVKATLNASRLAQTTEFMQIVTDLIVTRDMPEKRDAILSAVAQRLEQFHGAR
jgi:metal-responsive CopG/Arc/MetJ family transcriptional regulator